MSKRTVNEPDTVESLYRGNFLTEIEQARSHLLNAVNWLNKMGRTAEADELNKARDGTFIVWYMVKNNMPWSLDKEAKE